MQLNQKELISVIIPFYNEEIYFDECINSALSQTYLNYEIIIVNDGSEKIFEKKLENLQSNNPEKIKVFNKENEGVSAARNYGIKKSKGEYIAFLDADDVWLPCKLEYQLYLLKKYNLNFIHSSYVLVDENESFRGKALATKLNYEKLINSCDIGLSTVLVKSNLMKKHLFKNISTKEDYVCWLSIVKEIKQIYGDEKVLTIYRIKKKSLSNNNFLKFINAFKVYYVFEKKNLYLSLIRTIFLSISWIYKSYKIYYKYPDKIEFKYIKKITNLNFQNSFILSALNMASLSNIDLFYLNHKDMIFWLDGYWAKFIIKDFNKIPGRKIIDNINIPTNLKKIYLCGNKSELQIKYLESKYKKEIFFKNIPFIKQISDIKKIDLYFEDESLVIINISTPKQELLAKNILKINKKKKIYIICLGGGMAMVTGEEKIVPDNIEKLNLEWLWRLQSNTFFRIKRLLSTFTNFSIKKITNYFNKINFISLD